MKQAPTNKMQDPHLGDAPSSRTSEVVIVRDIHEDGSVTCVIRRMPQHTCTIAASVMDGLGVRVGDELLVATRSPIGYGFIKGGLVWMATAIISRKAETKS